MFALQQSLRIAIILVFCTLVADACAQAGVAGAAPAAGQQFRVVRSVSGSEGSEQGGRFVVEDPRNTFYLPEDTKVLVYFEWEGPTGHHLFEATWRNPEGRPVALSDFRYEAKERRFAGYWTLLLTDTTAPGTWTMEARINGEPAGAHTFQVVAAEKPEAQGPVRRLLAPAELYQQALAATVTIEKLDAAGEPVDRASAFSIGDGRLVTLFQAIDGAGRLRVLLPSGGEAEVSAVLAHHRLQDWAVLRTSASLPGLELAPEGSWAVGDRCYTLDVDQGSRVLADTAIRGVAEHPRTGHRLNIAFSAAGLSAGAPLLNEYGEVIGVMGAAQMPGMSSLRSDSFGYPGNLAQAGVWRGSTLAVPISAVKATGLGQGYSLEELANAGEFTVPLARVSHIGRGTMSRLLERRSGYLEPIDEKFEFSRSESKAHVMIMWSPKERIRSQLSFRVYEVFSNRLVGESPPRRISLNRGNTTFTSWEMDLRSLPPGDYRVDVVLAAEPVWRTYFRMKD